MIRLPSHIRTLIAIAHDFAMAGLSFVLALLLRLGEDAFTLAQPYLLFGTFAFAGTALMCFIAMRLYRGLWRYASMPDLLALVKAVTFAVAVFYGVVLFATTRLEGVPRAVPLIQWMLLICMLGTPRVLYRAVKDRTLRFDFRHDASKQMPLLLIGATGTAELFIRDCLRDRECPWRVVGLLDDREKRRYATLMGVPIFGGTKLLKPLVSKLERKGMKPRRVIVCDDAMDGTRLSSLLETCENLGIPLGRLPTRQTFREGMSDKPEIRPVAIEDLLGRSQHLTDRTALGQMVGGKRVLITGAGGSIGAELTRQLAALSPHSVALLEQSEHALYQIDLEMQERFPSLACESLLADVRSLEQMHAIFTRFRPEMVFHAAAVKHVPLAESNPLAAIETNVFGTRNVARAAKQSGCETLLLISTDKAVNPCNVMGATKRLAELVCQTESGEGGKTRFVSVRFGNVLGSTGSVVPLFERQLARGGPLTVTHPDMVRYFMTIREAVELVIQAAAMADEAESSLFVLDMGKPVRISELATQMIRLAGLHPGQDVEVVYTGLRPGEKLFEELFYAGENVEKTKHPSILRASRPASQLAGLDKSLDLLQDLCKQRRADEALAALKRLVPEFRAEGEADRAPPHNIAV